MSEKNCHSIVRNSAIALRTSSEHPLIIEPSSLQPMRNRVIPVLGSLKLFSVDYVEKWKIVDLLFGCKDHNDQIHRM